MEDLIMREHYELVRDKVVPALEKIGYSFASEAIFKMIDSQDYTIDLLKSIYSRDNNG